MDWLFHLLGLCPDHGHFAAMVAGLGLVLAPAVSWVRCGCRRCWRCLAQLFINTP